MKSNVGRFDRNLRMVLGFVILIVGIALNNWWGAVGAILLATGIFAWCPIYSAFRLDTSRHDPKTV